MQLGQGKRPQRPASDVQTASGDLVPLKIAGERGPIGRLRCGGPLFRFLDQTGQQRHVAALPASDGPFGIGGLTLEHFQLAACPRQRAFQNAGEHQPGADVGRGKLGIGERLDR